MDIEIIRGIERLIIVIFSGASIFLGWNLFRVGVVDPQSAVFSGKGYKFALQKAGPGVFFALFGSIVLSIALINGLTRTTKKDEAIIMYAGENKDERKVIAQSINTLSLVDMEMLATIPGKRKRIKKAINSLQGYRDNLVRQVFGAEKVDEYKKCYSQDQQHACRNTESFMEIESWRNGTY
ncbi:hypothetical protein [Photobacterium alginatilyticum]|uniref:Uncharacterized protein n=1 Tax=Photobacterium alginatilyticum TaxID=1775171 RepID=A0ABW9YDN4_9GAMM|nr:hypothetical protein [Photobacterium alginatilyticum]NBI51833.1 hypothetical protein [Photobacterium alginatilyticum]